MRFARIAFLLIVGLVCARGVAAQTAHKGLVDYKQRDVFFEMFYDDYAEPEQVGLLRVGKIELKPLGTESIAGFDWVHHDRADESWWQRIENFTYLLPMIASDDPADHKWLEKWFNTWYEVHAFKEQPNAGAWDPMTASYRAMVLVYWLKVAESRDTSSDTMTRNIRRMIERHQRFLQKDENFDDASNHGLWEAIGLFETTRVYSSTDLTQLALDRLITLAKTAVSQEGLEKEHSPRYHFFFLDWLGQQAAYLESLSLDWGQGVRDLAQIEERMRRAAYFLYDKGGNMPQIGDTDATALSDDYRKLVAPQEDDVFYDPEAGMAIFKDAPGSGRGRYLVFCNQNEEFMPYFRYHFHNDMMAVYLSDDGEVLLGDAGRYSYSRSEIRAYLMSMAAHNTILPKSMIIPNTPGIFVAHDVWYRDEPDSVTFGAVLVDDVVRREVTVSRKQSRIVVRDAINNPDVFVMLWQLGHDVAEHKAGKVVKYAQWRTYEYELQTKKHAKYRLRIRVDGRNGVSHDEMDILSGQKDPYLGWYSPGYNVLQPAPTIKLTLNPRSAEEPINVTTEITRIDR